MAIDRVNFGPLGEGGDNVTAALVKLDANCAELANAVGDSESETSTLAERVTAVEEVVDGLGNASTRDVGTSANTVAAGDDPRFSITRGLKNKIINGSLRFWQRGFSQSVAGYGSVDRFLNNLSGGATCALSRQLAAGGLLSPLGVTWQPRYFVRAVVAAGSGTAHYATLQHRVEDCRTLAGKRVTLSWFARAATAGMSMAVELARAYGAAGSPQDAGIGVKKVTLTAAWQRFSSTFTMPDLTGKGIDDAAGVNALILNFWFNAGSDFSARTSGLGAQSGTFEVLGIQLEEGEVATDFEERPEALELLLCQRYYEKSFDVDVPPAPAAAQGIVHSATVWNAASSIYTYIAFRTTKRATPTMSAYSPSEFTLAMNTTWAFFNQSTGDWRQGATVTGFGRVSPNEASVSISATAPANVMGQAVLVSGNWAADAEL